LEIKAIEAIARVVSKGASVLVKENKLLVALFALRYYTEIGVAKIKAL